MQACRALREMNLQKQFARGYNDGFRIASVLFPQAYIAVPPHFLWRELRLRVRLQSAFSFSSPLEQASTITEVPRSKSQNYLVLAASNEHFRHHKVPFCEGFPWLSPFHTSCKTTESFVKDVGKCGLKTTSRCQSNFTKLGRTPEIHNNNRKYQQQKTYSEGLDCPDPPDTPVQTWPTNYWQGNDQSESTAPKTSSNSILHNCFCCCDEMTRWTQRIESSRKAINTSYYIY